MTNHFTQEEVRAALEQALDALELANNGLIWYRENHPEVVDGSDDEANEEIDAALTAGRAALETPQEPVMQSDIDFLPHDDSLRFIQRTLESNAPKQDRDDALKKVRDIRRSIYIEKAQP